MIKAPKWFISWFLTNCQMATKLDQVRQVEDAYLIYLKGKADQRKQTKKNKLPRI